MRKILSRFGCSATQLISVEVISQVDHPTNIKAQAQLLSVSGILLLALHATLWAHLPDIVASDTILTLSLRNRLFLVSLALIASVALTLCCLGKTRYIQRTIGSYAVADNREGIVSRWVVAAVSDFIATAGLLWLAMMVAPQLFYTLYQLLIPELPVQWVVNPLPFSQWVSLLFLDPADSLADLSSGFLMLYVMLATLLSWLYPVSLKMQGNPHRE